MVVFLNIPSSLPLAFLASLLMSVAIVATKGLHLHRSAKGHAGLEIQSAHRIPTPRIGGMAIGLALGLVAVEVGGFDSLIVLILMSALPVFFAGFAEDFGYSASPRRRLVASMISGLILILVTGYVVDHGVFPGIDMLLSFHMAAAALTIFATASVCHSINLIDGMNGLSSTASLAGSLSLGYIAYSVGDTEVSFVAFTLSAAIAGFFVLNFPFGKLFLGDAGAYTVGFVLASIGVALVARNPDVASWSAFLALFWPCFDTIYTVSRRMARGKPVSLPDKMHFHHVVKRVWDSHLPDETAETWSNPLTTAVMAPIIILPSVLATFSYDDANWVIVYLVLCCGIYYGGYHMLARNFRMVSRSKRLKRLTH